MQLVQNMVDTPTIEVLAASDAPPKAQDPGSLRQMGRPESCRTAVRQEGTRLTNPLLAALLTSPCDPERLDTTTPDMRAHTHTDKPAHHWAMARAHVAHELMADLAAQGQKCRHATPSAEISSGCHCARHSNCATCRFRNARHRVADYVGRKRATGRWISHPFGSTASTANVTRL